MRKSIYILLFISCTSCVFWENQKIDESQLLEEELNTIDLTKVDVYPTFEGCSTDETNVKNKACLERILKAYLVRELRQHPQELAAFYQQELVFYFTSFPNHDFFLDSLHASSKTTNEVILEHVKLHMSDLPTLFPAQKRGVPVKTTFEVAVKIR